MIYKELTPEEVQEHADWYESIVFVDKKGRTLPLRFEPDPTPDPEGDAV